MKHVPQSRTHDQHIWVVSITLETNNQIGQIGHVRSPNEIQFHTNLTRHDLIIAVPLEQIGLDRVRALGTQNQLEQREREQPRLGVPCDDDPGAVEQIGGVGRGELLEATHGNWSRGGPVPGPIAGTPNYVVEEGEAGDAGVEDDEGGDGGGEVGDGGEVGGEVDADGEGDEEGAAEEEHLVAAEVPPGHSHGHEEHHARRHHAQLHRSQHLFFFFCPFFFNWYLLDLSAQCRLAKRLQVFICWFFFLSSLLL